MNLETIKNVSTIQQKSGSDIFIENKKLPLQTINKINCLTECKEKGRTYINPVTLDSIMNSNEATCAIVPIPVSNNDTTNYYTWGTCRLEDNDIYHVPSEKDSMLLNFHFDPYDFLTQIYDLHTFNQVINWTLENNHFHFETIKRVHNASWKIFGLHIENISELVIDFYYDIAKNNWMNDYINNILKKYSFDILSTGEKNTNINNIIISKFFDKKFFIQIIKKYLIVYANNWTNIESHYKNLKNFTYRCIMKNIKYKINKDNKENKNVNLFKN